MLFPRDIRPRKPEHGRRDLFFSGLPTTLDWRIARPMGVAYSGARPWPSANQQDAPNVQESAPTLTHSESNTARGAASPIYYLSFIYLLSIYYLSIIYYLNMSPSPPKRVHSDSTNNSSEKRIMRISIEGNIGKFSMGVTHIPICHSFGTLRLVWGLFTAMLHWGTVKEWKQTVVAPNRSCLCFCKRTFCTAEESVAHPVCLTRVRNHQGGFNILNETVSQCIDIMRSRRGIDCWAQEMRPPSWSGHPLVA